MPLNLIGDFGGGALYLAMGILAALHEARASGQGQVVDAAMVDGAAHLLTMHYGYRQSGFWNLERGSDAVDGGAPYYTTYRTLDSKFMAVGAVEKRFYAEMIQRLGLDPATLPGQDDRDRWPELQALLAAVFATRSRNDWATLFEGTDACVSPVLDMDEAVAHPVARERGMFHSADGIHEPNPAPRFDRTPAAAPTAPRDARADTAENLAHWGFGPAEITALSERGVIAPQALARNAASSA